MGSGATTTKVAARVSIMRIIIFLSIMLVWNTGDSMKKPMKQKPMKEPMMEGGLCLKEEDMMKFCVVGSSLQSKTKIAEEYCKDDRPAVAEDVFKRIVRGVEQKMGIEQRIRKPGKGKRPNKKPGKKPGKKPENKPEKKPNKNQGKAKPKPEKCPTIGEVMDAFSMSYSEEVCALYEFGWLDIDGLETLGSWANTEIIEADLRNLTTIISEALLPLLDHHTNTNPQVAKCYEDAETSIMKKLFPGCSKLTLVETEIEKEVEFVMSLATWIECFHSMFEDACKEHVEYTCMSMNNEEITQTTEENSMKLSWITEDSLEMKIGDKNLTVILTPTTNIPNFFSPCLFQGYIEGDPVSEVSVSGCHNSSKTLLTISGSEVPGGIRDFSLVDGITSDVMFGIGGSDRRQADEDGTVDFLIPPPDLHEPSAAFSGPLPENVLLTTDAAYDNTLLQHFQNSHHDTKDWINRVFSLARTYMSHNSLTPRLGLKLRHVFHIDENINTNTSSNASLDYLNGKKIPQLTSYFVYDIGDNPILGVAHLKAACATNGVANNINRLYDENNPIHTTAHVFAHELGHNVGMLHDFDNTHGGWGGECDNEGIMSYGDPPKKWSTCSNNDFQNYWREKGFRCIKELPVCAIFYEHDNYGGEYFSIPGDSGEWRGDGRWNDRISSLRTFSNACKVTLYEHTNFQGRFRVMNKWGNSNSWPTLERKNWAFGWYKTNWWNDKVSSAKCEC